MATPAWTRSEGKSKSGGLNAKGIASYRAANPGSKLKKAVTTKPSKLKAGSKDAKRRKSFCSRMVLLRNLMVNQQEKLLHFASGIVKQLKNINHGKNEKGNC
jgi:hypothetical protein